MELSDLDARVYELRDMRGDNRFSPGWGLFVWGRWMIA